MNRLKKLTDVLKPRKPKGVSSGKNKAATDGLLKPNKQAKPNKKFGYAR